MDKREILFEYLIKEYLHTHEPIGSEFLRLRIDIKVSSATIRNYFKKMVDDGELAQPHISSGRIPTNKALKRYWKHKLLPLKKISVNSINQISHSAQETGLFCIVKFFKQNIFIELVNVKDRYLLLIFEDGEAMIRYSEPLERFLQSIIFTDIRDLYKISKDLCINSIYDALEVLLRKNQTSIKGSNDLIDMSKEHKFEDDKLLNCLKGDLFEQVNNGLYFRDVIPEGYMAIKQDININTDDAKILLIGRLTKNFEEFYQLLNKQNRG